MGSGGIGRGPILPDEPARGRLRTRMVSTADATIEVTDRPVDASRIPDSLREGVGLLLLLWRSGVGDAVGERVHIRRQGGYSGLDVWLLRLAVRAVR